jgi:hypothetical protein
MRRELASFNGNSGRYSGAQGVHYARRAQWWREDNCELDCVRQMTAEQRAIPAIIVDAVIARLDNAEAKSVPGNPISPVERYRVSGLPADHVASFE